MTTTTFNRRSLFKLAGAAGLTLMLTACGPDPKPQFHGSDISGTGLGSGLNMIDHTGQPRTLADYNGKALVVFFGFTHCPDVCPTALAHISQSLSLLGDQAKDVQVMMISVDPERDTPEILANYVKAFNPDFAGLTGTTDQLKETARSFKAFYAKVPDRSNNTYTMDHTASFYLFDKNGQARVLVNATAPADQLAADIKALL